MRGRASRCALSTARSTRWMRDVDRERPTARPTGSPSTSRTSDCRRPGARAAYSADLCAELQVEQLLGERRGRVPGELGARASSKIARAKAASSGRSARTSFDGAASASAVRLTIACRVRVAPRGPIGERNSVVVGTSGSPEREDSVAREISDRSEEQAETVFVVRPRVRRQVVDGAEGEVDGSACRRCAGKAVPTAGRYSERTSARPRLRASAAVAAAAAPLAAPAARAGPPCVATATAASPRPPSPDVITVRRVTSGTGDPPSGEAADRTECAV